MKIHSHLSSLLGRPGDGARGRQRGFGEGALARLRQQLVRLREGETVNIALF